eukprot:CAMPEP_0180699138 /NCGR_PEP_ID=MMETSP1038_2-20121128/4397_1 /TAXON_ID=632150 /ORGANISM="Azadinium spinosum, Strain 3D9" /LENGTH=172 /DNA_ID=CAMNT_0022730753 /DNA_START=164 /DNA_END=680 /DNA_ORIENTATION=+
MASRCCRNDYNRCQGSQDMERRGHQQDAFPMASMRSGWSLYRLVLAGSADQAKSLATEALTTSSLEGKSPHLKGTLNELDRTILEHNALLVLDKIELVLLEALFGQGLSGWAEPPTVATAMVVLDLPCDLGLATNRPPNTSVQWLQARAFHAMMCELGRRVDACFADVGGPW